MTVLKEVGQFIWSNPEEIIMALVAMTIIFNIFFLMNWVFKKFIEPKLDRKAVSIVKPLYNFAAIATLTIGILSMFQ
ncbi:hypothetical protein [Bacillus coahuilensis]|uniref:hypothetical protein n=1 Tax=Bacillus coahuilensis TaxID=408580 RepID=UPI0001850926|nr:hypothetical protein [Bacillus coahuilensis]